MLTWKKKKQGAELRVTMKGHITEQTPLVPLAEEIAAGPVVFDLAEVSRINSTGCREWLDMVEALGAKGIPIVLERCSVPIVQQLSMIAGFGGNGYVRSVFVPFFCEECDRESDQLVDEAGVRQVLATGVACPGCASPMEIDELPETYEGLLGLLERPSM